MSDIPGACGAGLIPPLIPSLAALLIIALLGVGSSSRAAAYAGVKDPQHIVIDEVSFQAFIDLVLASVPPWAADGLLARG